MTISSKLLTTRFREKLMKKRIESKIGKAIAEHLTPEDCFREKLMKKRIESFIFFLCLWCFSESFREKLMKKRIESDISIPVR